MKLSRNKMKSKQDDSIYNIINDYGNNIDNIFPQPMTDTEFRKHITTYFLGEDWYTVMPMGQEQVNVEILISIMEMYKPKR